MAFIFPNTMGAWLTLIGLLITVILYVRKVPGALVISILVTTAIVGLIIGFTDRAGSFTATPSFDHTRRLRPDATCSTNSGSCAAALTIFSFMLTDFFDTMGTATASSNRPI